MPCYRPLKGYQKEPGGPLHFHGDGAPAYQNSERWIEVQCGQCIGCRLEQSRTWAVRLMHEAACHERNSFITLTYATENLPPDMSLDITHWQKFIRSLRKRKKYQHVRFFQCGEYGDKNHRPHFHACMFGVDFTEDRTYLKKSRSGHALYTSPFLSKVWRRGYHYIGDLTFESAAYVARYCTKKVNGKPAAAHYQRACPLTGETISLTPELATMSRRPGIGHAWFEQWADQVYPRDEICINGKLTTPPRYYDKLWEQHNPEELEKLKLLRRQKQKLAKLRPSASLETRERVTKRNHKQFIREPENSK